MKPSELEKLSTEELKKKEKGTKTLIGIFIPLILGLLYFGLRGYFTDAGSDNDTPTLIIAICSIGGLVSLLPQLKAIREELKKRT